MKVVTWRLFCFHVNTLQTLIFEVRFLSVVSLDFFFTTVECG
jgi:hypothetical protein